MMDGSRRDHRTIDVVHVEEELASSIQNTTLNNSFMSPKCCIFKIPSILNRDNRKSYYPKAFSIGPLHHGKPHLKDTKKIKLQYLRDLISRAPTKETSLKNFIEAIGKLESEARECYAVPIDFSPNEFVKMLVLDGCFIIELLRRNANELLRGTYDPVFHMSCMLPFLYHDLILLENQIPWRVLDCLFSMTMLPNSKSLAELAINFFRTSFSVHPLHTVDASHGSVHILDLIRNSLVLSWGGGDKGLLTEMWQLIPNATRLAEAGIKFKKGSKSILDIKFRNGVLEIPPFSIQESTGDAARNLISFEQCYHKCTPMITSHAIFLEFLINTTKDINILIQNRIIDVWLYPGEAIHFYNKLYRETYAKEFYYLDLCHEVNEYCRGRWPRLRAMYMHHFTNPWAIVSQVAGGIALLFTLLQTFCSVKQ